MQQIAIRVFLSAAVLLTALAGISTPVARGQGNGQFFPETGIPVQGRFLDYWQSHGGLAQQGYPLSERDQRGLRHRRQDLHRAVFRARRLRVSPGKRRRPTTCCSACSASSRYQQQYPQRRARPARQHRRPRRLFAETGHTVGGKFRAYWESHGGLAQQGYPHLRRVHRDQRRWTASPTPCSISSAPCSSGTRRTPARPMKCC